MPAVAKQKNDKPSQKSRKISVLSEKQQNETKTVPSAKETTLTIDSLKQKRVNPFSCLLFATKSVDVPFTKELETFLTVRKKEMDRFKFSLKTEVFFLLSLSFNLSRQYSSHFTLFYLFSFPPFLQMVILQRTLYKIRNAHKSTLHFQKLKEVNRATKLLHQLLISYIPPIIESYEQLASFEIAYRSARRPKTVSTP